MTKACRVAIRSGVMRDNLMYGSTTSNYLQWDASANTLQLVGTGNLFRLGTFASSTSGSGTALDATNSYAMGVFVDDGGAAIGSGTLMRAIRARTLLTYTSGNREQEVASVIGQINSVGGTNRHNMCGVMGSYELSGTSALVVDGQASSTDPWAQAAIIARVGVGSSKTTINSNGVLAGVAAMSNTAAFTANNGTYAGFYVGKWTGTTNWGYGLYVDAVGSTVGAALCNTLTPNQYRTYNALLLGGTPYDHSATGAATITVAASTNQNVDPMSICYSIAGSNPTGTSTYTGIYQMVSHATTDMSNFRVRGSYWNIEISKNIKAAYVCQNQLDILTNSVTIASEACALSGHTQVASAVTGNVWGVMSVFTTDQTHGGNTAANLFVSNRGTGTLPHAIYLEVNSGMTITNYLYFNTAGTATYLLNFSAAAGPIAADTSNLPAAATHKIKCKVGTTDFYLIGVADF